MDASELPANIALFPLPGALLLPRGQLPLHVFEPRYLRMLEDVLATPTRLIGMIQPCGSPSGDPNLLQSIGCAGRVTQFRETDDGRYMITLTGVSRFRMGEELTRAQAPYRRAKANWSGFERDLGPPESDPGLDRSAFFDLLQRFLRNLPLKTDWQTLQDADDELLINALSALAPFSPEERQALLEAPSLNTRRETLIMLMEFALRGPTSDETEGPLQ